MDALNLKPPNSTTSSTSIGVRSNGSIAFWYGIFQMALKGSISFNIQYLLTIFVMAMGAFLLATTQFTGESALRLFWEDLDRPIRNRVIVYPDAGPNQILLDHRPTEKLTLQDFKFLQRHLPDVRYVAPAFYGRSLVTSETKRCSIPIDGISRMMESEAVYRPIAGTGFSDAAYSGLVWECMLTRSAAKALDIDLNKHPYLYMERFRLRVKGIIADPSEPDARFQNKLVVPFITAQMLWGKLDQVDHIVVAWNNYNDMEAIIERLQKALDTCRAPGAYYLSYSNFKAKNRREIVSKIVTFGSAQAYFCVFLATVGLINVLLTNVIRRRREFAIRVAMGAKKRTITLTVLIESVLSGLIGSALGIVAAIAAANPICTLISSHVSAKGFELLPHISTKGMLLPLLVCTTSGFVAGILPAIRTKRLDILAVLRHE
ncbi:MAG: ABC transporter permease [Desulfobacteraceae bacterium]|jgi:ABC-type lipoprotein release transport system permease subunit